MLTKIVLQHPFICLLVVLLLNLTPLATKSLHDKVGTKWTRLLHLAESSLFGSFIIPLLNPNPTRQEYALAHYKIASIIGAFLNTFVLLLLLGVLLLPTLASALNNLIGLLFMAIVFGFILILLNALASTDEDAFFWFFLGRMTK